MSVTEALEDDLDAYLERELRIEPVEEDGPPDGDDSSRESDTGMRALLDLAAEEARWLSGLPSPGVAEPGVVEPPVVIPEWMRANPRVSIAEPVRGAWAHVDEAREFGDSSGGNARAAEDEGGAWADVGEVPALNLQQQPWGIRMGPPTPAWGMSVPERVRGRPRSRLDLMSGVLLGVAAVGVVAAVVLGVLSLRILGYGGAVLGSEARGGGRVPGEVFTDRDAASGGSAEQGRAWGEARSRGAGSLGGVSPSQGLGVAGSPSGVTPSQGQLQPQGSEGVVAPAGLLPSQGAGVTGSLDGVSPSQGTGLAGSLGGVSQGLGLAGSPGDLLPSQGGMSPPQGTGLAAATGASPAGQVSLQDVAPGGPAGLATSHGAMNTGATEARPALPDMGGASTGDDARNVARGLHADGARTGDTSSTRAFAGPHGADLMARRDTLAVRSAPRRVQETVEPAATRSEQGETPAAPPEVREMSFDSGDVAGDAAVATEEAEAAVETGPDEAFARELGFTEEAEAARAEEQAPARTVYVPPSLDGKEHLTPDDVRQVVVANQPAITACIRQHAQDTSAQKGGRFTVRWSVLPGGETTGVAMETESLRSTPLAGCIEGVVRGWKFPVHRVRMSEPIRFPFVF
ncbi:AgmX/PglI C-terminal domain-containing protein [Myxococcus stipitatus]|uniref:AgmX/PglI C-terminal domain-containing protein n=1 Tax=Myxococcus stipitatus TaxID=83455 RepID=UPI001F4582F1|nr:AgmX/PglI C-terminal domain-containing protein [Myxococcus stipitatus]MCE9668985.1 AgmX/PglI C-terminal domain-containing protein [Myxococcus stipitatus]